MLETLMNAEVVRKARMRAGSLVVDTGFGLLSRAGRLHPRLRPEAWNVEVVRDVAYRPGGREEHLLDVYRPRAPGPHPAVLYVHGGGFRILSKDSHYGMALSFARRGFTVFNINYRLAPRHPYPAAIEDVVAAFDWLAANAERFGGDRGRLVLAGESAGANLVSALTVAACYRRPEPFARAAFESGLRPRAVVAACGMLQVSDPDRFARRRRVPLFIQDRLEEVSRAYLDRAERVAPGGLDLADPLRVLEGEARPERPLPPFFAFAGTRDILLDDTRRLGKALERMGVPNQVRIYPGEVHAFHALLWRPMAATCWQETFDFLERHLSPG